MIMVASGYLSIALPCCILGVVSSIETSCGCPVLLGAVHFILCYVVNVTGVGKPFRRTLPVQRAGAPAIRPVETTSYGDPGWPPQTSYRLVS